MVGLKFEWLHLPGSHPCLCVYCSATSMAGAMKKVDKIRQIVRLKQMLMRWRRLSLPRPPLISSESHSHPLRRTPSGFVAVYIGPESKRFVIPTRFLNLPIFLALLKRAEDEFGFQTHGALVLPCDASFFTQIIHYLHADEHRYGKFSLDEFLKLVSDVASDSCKESAIAFTPLLQKARV